MKDNYNEIGEIECIFVKTDVSFNITKVTAIPENKTPLEMEDDWYFLSLAANNFNHIHPNGIYRLTLSLLVEIETMKNGKRYIGKGYYKIEKSEKIAKI